jgi:endo-1,4-beta-D-glucanase Y
MQVIKAIEEYQTTQPTFTQKTTLWFKNFISKIDPIEMFVLIFALLIVIISHAYNMFQFPYYENDEGIYQAQAWAIIKLNQLAPYTYFYDHAPAGWIILSLFTQIIGGFFSYNFSGLSALDTGRIVILIFKIFTVLFVYGIIKNQTGRSYLAAIGMIVMSVSPLAIYYQRRILLDNVMITLVMASLYLISKKQPTLIHTIFASIILGIAVLSKESAIFFVPGFIILMFLQLGDTQKKLGTALNISFFSSVIILYPIMALLKTELFTSPNRVSLINTLFYQVSRGAKVPFWDFRSDILYNITIWKDKDINYLYFVAATIFFTIIALILKRNKFIFGVFLILSGMILFLIRGGLVLDFYILPIIPLIAILAMLSISDFIDIGKKVININMKKSVITILTISIIGFVSFYQYQNKTGHNPYTKSENTTLNQSLEYVKKNVPQNAKVLIDHSHWLNLRGENGTNFPNADYFYKADYDSAIKNQKLNNDWKNVDYVVASHQIYKSIADGITPLVKDALDNSFVIADFEPTDDYKVIHDSRYLSVNGSWSTVFKTNNNSDMLKKLNKVYNDKFVTPEGRVIDDQSKLTTSEGQSYVMLRSVLTGDKEMFDKVWNWTAKNLQIHNQDKLFAWKYGTFNGETKILETEAATDADLDIAYALLKASDTFKDPKYLDQAKLVIKDIYNLRVKTYNGQSLLLPFITTSQKGFEILNPSYFSPMYYREFSKIDPEHNWAKLTDDTYALLDKINQNHVLYPDWIQYDINTGQLSSAKDYMNQPTADNFSFDAMRVMLRIGQDYQKNNDSRALNILKKAAEVFNNNLNGKTLKTSINPNGGEAINYETSAMNAMSSIALNTLNSNNKSKIWKDQILNQTNYQTGQFKDNSNYYDQNMIWFAYAYNYEIFK